MTNAITLAPTTSLQQKFQSAQRSANVNFLDREVAILCMLVGMLSRQHVLLVGPPGTAKSQLSRAIFQLVDQATIFDKLLTKFTSPEEVFGPLDIPALMGGSADGRAQVILNAWVMAQHASGHVPTMDEVANAYDIIMSAAPVAASEYKRDLTGYLADTHFAMLDEVGKASSAILNNLLTQMNERIYHNGNTVTKTPLQMLIGASNELPDGDELSALYDRFPLRVEVQYLSDANFELFLGTCVAGVAGTMPNALFTMQELEQAQLEVRQVAISPAVLADLVKLRGILRDDGFTASDRRWGQSIVLLQAHAWLNGRNVVDDEDYDILQHGLWARPNERAKIASKIAMVANPLKAEVNALVDGVAEIMDNLTAAARKAKDGIRDKDVKTMAMEKHDIIKDSQAKLVELMKMHNKQFIQLALDKVKVANKTIVGKFFGLSDD